jgi:hypothetical protein
MDPSVYRPHGVFTFRIQGELYHLMGSLLPADGQDPAFAQIYIYDSNPEHQVDMRMAHQHNRLNRSTTLDLQQMITHHNPYYTAFKTAHERLQQSEHLSLHLNTIDASHLDSRRYNRPTASEVAVLMPGTGEEVTNGKRDIVLHHRRVGFQ